MIYYIKNSTPSTKERRRIRLIKLKPTAALITQNKKKKAEILIESLTDKKNDGTIDAKREMRTVIKIIIPTFMGGMKINTPSILKQSKNNTNTFLDIIVFSS